jgi:hypothetical protein
MFCHTQGNNGGTMKIKTLADRGEPFKDSVKLYPEHDKDVADISLLMDKANQIAPTTCSVEWGDNGKLIYAYLNIETLMKIAIST